MEQESVRPRQRMGSVVPRVSLATSMKNPEKKGKQAVNKANMKKHVRLLQDPQEEEIIQELHNLNLDKDHLRTGTALVYHPIMAEPRCLWNNQVPEVPERVIATMDKLQECGLLERCKQILPRLATKEELMLVHTPDYIDMVKSTKEMSTTALQAKSDSFDLVYFHPRSYDASCTAVGCVLQLVDSLLEGDTRNGLAVVRPPGHHAHEDTANTYCIFNTLAIAAMYARKRHGVERVMIVDWDIYHGQGTQYIFEEDPSVLLFSIHRYEHGDFWPHLAESDCTSTGTGQGKGYNINLPWNKIGMTDADYYIAFHKLLLPIAHEYQPDLILVAAGFNFTLAEPQGKMTVTPACFAHLTHMLMPLAEGRVLLSLEGGDNLQAMANCTVACLKVLLGDACPQLISTSSPCQSALESISAVISVHRKFWKCLRSRELSSWQDTQTTLEVIEVPSEGEILQDIMAEVMRPLPPHRTGLLYDERMKEHYNMWDFQHPEQPQRISQIFRRHEELHLVERCFLILALPAMENQLEMCHGSSYLTLLKSTKDMNSRELHRQSCEYNSIFISPQTYDSALLAVGSIFTVVEAVLTGQVQNGAAIIRPPGHHAERDMACGFCFFNNVALAARFAQNLVGHKIKVLILDWDIHHGNGTQHMFEDDPSVLYISLHRYDNGSFFPNSEDADYTKVGIDAGEGFNVNIPWNGANMGDMEYLSAFHRLVMPISYQYQPDLVLVSAGFDAARGDPLGGCQVSPECYAHMTHMLMGLAGGRIVLALEGGYNLTAISESMAMCTQTLLGDTPPYLQQRKLISPSAAESISNVVLVHHKYWSCLRLLAPELELQQQQPKVRMWVQQPTTSTVPAPETRVQVSQSRRTSMWLQQQIPMVNIMEADPQVSQSRRASAWSQQQMSLQLSEADTDSQTAESRRGSLLRQEPPSVAGDDFEGGPMKRRVSLWPKQLPPAQNPELDVTGKPIPQPQKALWPQEPAPSPLAILPMEVKPTEDDHGLDPFAATLDPFTTSAAGPSPRTGTRPKRTDPEASKEKEHKSTASRNLNSKRTTLGTELVKDGSSSASSGAGSKMRLSSDEDAETTVQKHHKGKRQCAESANPVPDTLGVLHAVAPLMWCPHLELIHPLPEAGLDVNETCHECGSDRENWVCLTCYKVYCGRYVNEHMMIHGLKNDHSMVLSYADLSVWCYSCESYVHNELLLPAKSEAHQKKFGVEFPTGA